MWRPPFSPPRTAPQPGKSVRFDPVRSALPPSNSGTLGASTASTFCEALRDASVSVDSAELEPSRRAASRRSRAAARRPCGARTRRPAPGARRGRPRSAAATRPRALRPAARASQRAAIGAASRTARAASRSPRGCGGSRRRPAARRAPWPCPRAPGEPLPIVVRQTIKRRLVGGGLRPGDRLRRPRPRRGRRAGRSRSSRRRGSARACRR